jgi:opacity protein-like surface antigen
MKKFLTTSIISAMLIATTGQAFAENFFAKVNLGYSRLNDSFDLASEDTTFWGIGAGYNVMDNARVDLTFDHFSKPIFKNNGKKATGEIDSLLLNGFIDLFDIVLAKAFIGAGIGGSKVQANFTGKGFSHIGSSKASYNLTYAMYLGCSLEFIPNITGEIVYSYRDMGKSKDFYGQSLQLKGSQIATGLRFSF